MHSSHQQTCFSKNRLSVELHDSVDLVLMVFNHVVNQFPLVHALFVLYPRVGQMGCGVYSVAD